MVQKKRKIAEQFLSPEEEKVKKTRKTERRRHDVAEQLKQKEVINKTTVKCCWGGLERTIASKTMVWFL